MKQSVRKAVLGAAAASSVLALTTAPAHATGPTLATTQAITLTNYNAFTVMDTVTGWTISCTSSKGTGTAQVGTTPPPNPVIKISTLQFNQGAWGDDCTSPSLPMQVTAVGLPWSFNTTGPTSFGQTRGTLTGVKLSLYSYVDGCYATVTGPGGAGGSINSYYTNGTNFLALSPTSDLTVATANTNCDPWLITVGDTFKLTGTYKVSPPVVITVP
ncbi:hypothetical protein AB0J52_04465 [Spirillospora sp. NPDC049652]